MRRRAHLSVEALLLGVAHHPHGAAHDHLSTEQSRAGRSSQGGREEGGIAVGKREDRRAPCQNNRERVMEPLGRWAAAEQGVRAWNRSQGTMVMREAKRGVARSHAATELTKSPPHCDQKTQQQQRQQQQQQRRPG